MQQLNRFARIASQARTWRAVWIVVSLGLIALGAGAPDSWDTP